MKDQAIVPVELSYQVGISIYSLPISLFRSILSIYSGYVVI